MSTARLLPAALALLLVVTLVAPSAAANDRLKGRTYHFGTHPARTNITFVSEADLETIHGITHAVTGTVTVDAAGKKAAGNLRVGVDTLKTGIDLRDEHLRSDAWLDARKHPNLGLRLVSAVERKDGKTWDYTAKLTIKGVTRDLNGVARISAFPDSVGKALGPGSWVRVRTGFDVRLSHFGIKVPQQVGAKVSEIWKVTVDLYGTTVRPKPRR